MKGAAWWINPSRDPFGANCSFSEVFCAMSFGVQL
jgi:hypothetical protein